MCHGEKVPGNNFSLSYEEVRFPQIARSLSARLARVDSAVGRGGPEEREGCEEAETSSHV